MFERFDNLARRALGNAQRLALRQGSATIGTDHFLSATLHIILRQPRIEELARIVESLGIDTDAAAFVESGEGQQTDHRRTPIPLSPRTVQSFELAGLEAGRVGSATVRMRHLLLALIEAPGGPAVSWLHRLNVDIDQLYRQIQASDGISLGRIVARDVPDVLPARPVRPPPDFGSWPAALSDDLSSRLGRLPADRVHNYPDLWALEAVEHDHIGRLARQYSLSEVERQSVEYWWLRKVEAELAYVSALLHVRIRIRFVHRKRHRYRSSFLTQLRWNTIGPGAQCWFGNRHTTIRHYSFRLRWRP